MQELAPGTSRARRFFPFRPEPEVPYLGTFSKLLHTEGVATLRTAPALRSQGSPFAAAVKAVNFAFAHPQSLELRMGRFP